MIFYRKQTQSVGSIRHVFTPNEADDIAAVSADVVPPIISIH